MQHFHSGSECSFLASCYDKSLNVPQVWKDFRHHRIFWNQSESCRSLLSYRVNYIPWLYTSRKVLCPKENLAVTILWWYLYTVPSCPVPGSHFFILIDLLILHKFEYLNTFSSKFKIHCSDSVPTTQVQCRVALACWNCYRYWTYLPSCQGSRIGRYLGRYTFSCRDMCHGSVGVVLGVLLHYIT